MASIEVNGVSQLNMIMAFLRSVVSTDLYESGTDTNLVVDRLEAVASSRFTSSVSQIVFLRCEKNREAPMVLWKSRYTRKVYCKIFY